MMSGTIVFGESSDWTASSGVFNWVVGYLADTVDDQPTRDELRLIYDQNFRWLNLADLPDAGRRQVLFVLGHDLVSHGKEHLPLTDQRDEVVAEISELAALAVFAQDGEPS